MAPQAPTERLVIDPKWRMLPMGLLVAGGVFGLLGALVNTKQFAYSYLLAFMFFLSLCLGAMFLVLVHHLFDAAWSVPARRVAEHMMFLIPVMFVLFIPIAILAKPQIYNWMNLEHDHSV